SYYAAYPDEIDERITRAVEDADAAEAAWRREQAALA
ncbi:MAG: CopG family transcriptional regulator, partial [Solirubrobacterales bacterium]|nr:CopG family transcriptional regulator [Solirubrobacterales bacterium]